MSAPKEKTPVSALQEYLVLKKIKAEYKLSLERVGTHLPEFGFRVHVGELWEEGIGNSKQEAKHRAAEKMLIKLTELDKKEIKKEKNNEATSTPFENFVGPLLEFCKKHGYNEPKFELIDEKGRPHDKVFKMKCSLLEYVHYGEGKSIQLAKHNAACKMLETLKNMVYDKLNENLAKFKCEIKCLEPVSLPSESNITKNLQRLNLKEKMGMSSLGTFYQNQHENFVSLQDSSPTLVHAIRKINLIDVESSLELIKTIAKELKVRLECEVVQCDKLTVTIFVLNISIPIAAVGFSKSDAAFNLLNSLVLLASK